MDSSSVIYEDVFVADETVLAEPDRAWYTLNNERILVGAFCLGVIDGVLEDALDYMKQRKALRKSHRAVSNSPALYSYSASKAAIHTLSRDLVSDLADRNIAVNCVLPGYFPTKMNAHMRDDDGVDPKLPARIPMHRLGVADEIVGAIMFLASRAGGYVTGAEIPVNGGLVGCA